MLISKNLSPAFGTIIKYLLNSKNLSLIFLQVFIKEVSKSLQKSWITSICALHGNPFDGHTLEETVERAESMSGIRVKEIYVDRGYRGNDYTGEANVYSPPNGFKRITRELLSVGLSGEMQLNRQ